MKGKRAWSKSFGPYGCRVRAYERGGVMWLAIRLRGQPPRRESLKHRDRALAAEQAKHRQAELALGLATPARAPTLGAVLDAYLARVKERAGELRREAVPVTDRAITFWGKMLGRESDASRLTLDDVERACERRRSGAVNARGEPVSDNRRPVGARAVAADLEILRTAVRWAHIKRRLLRENPLMGLEIEHEENPRRPVATTDRYEATRAVTDQVTMQIRAEGKRFTATSYLAELLDLAYSTGRRISAILALRHEDLLLNEKPFGALRWAAESDKIGREWVTPIDERARAAIDRVLVDREVGTRSRWPRSPWLYPSPRNPERPVSKDLASEWLERAEELAKLPKLEGSLWHAYRRGWATARKGLPLADVAYVGGWKNLATLTSIYQRPDEDATRRVVLEAPELRETAPEPKKLTQC